MNGVWDDGGYVRFHAPHSQVPAFAGKTLRMWRVEATPGVIPELLRLTVSLWTLPCARLEPGGVFMEVKVFLCLPRTV